MDVAPGLPGRPLKSDPERESMQRVIRGALHAEPDVPFRCRAGFVRTTHLGGETDETQRQPDGMARLENWNAVIEQGESTSVGAAHSAPCTMKPPALIPRDQDRNRPQ